MDRNGAFKCYMSIKSEIHNEKAKNISEALYEVLFNYNRRVMRNNTDIYGNVLYYQEI